MKYLSGIATFLALTTALCLPLAANATERALMARKLLTQVNQFSGGAESKASSVIALYRNPLYRTKSLLQQRLTLVGGVIQLREVVQLDEGLQGFTMEVWDMPVAISNKSLGGWAMELRTLLPAIDIVELNTTFKPASTAGITDPGFARQWHLNPVAGRPAYGTAGLAAAWAAHSTQGAPVVVAVIDDGIVAHKDLPASRILQGRGFISNPEPGDLQPDSPINPGIGCNGRPTLWHGLEMSLVIAAASNGVGTVGGAPQASILPVRALGACGGTLSDIAKAVIWSAGGTVQGAPVNPTPAKVINMSQGNCNEGGCPPCPSTMQSAVNAALQRASVVVAAAGNEAFDGQQGSPASCNGVISVQGHAEDGELSDFSNASMRTSISAPAGGFSESSPFTSTFIITGSNAGNGKGAGADIDIAEIEGTSPAAAIVSAAVALAKSLKPQLDPSVINTLLQRTAKPHPARSYCTTQAKGQCAPGLLDTPAFLQEVATGGQSEAFRDRPHTTQTVKLGQTVVITTEAGSTTGRPLTYLWESLEKIVFEGQGSKTISAKTNTQMPYKNPIDLTFRLTVSDDRGNNYVSVYHVDLFANTLVARDASYVVESFAGPKPSKLPVQADAGVEKIELNDAPEGVQLVDKDSLDFSKVRVGRYSFSYRALDADGQVSNSAGVQLTVKSAPTSVDVPRPVPTQPNEVASGNGGSGGGGGIGLAGLLALGLVMSLHRRVIHSFSHRRKARL